MLAKFIRTLATTENPIPVLQEAFSEVAQNYSIGMLRIVFAVAPSFCTRNGENVENILFSSGDAVEEPTYHITYHTGEKGVATFYLHRILGTPDFTEQEKEELRAFIDVLFMSFGRARMINAVKQIGLTDQLTGLPNSGGFLTYVDEIICKGEILQYNAFYLNLARFSLVNKRFGIKETDTIIYRYARTVSAFLKEGECLGRLGGDNFVALIKKERTSAFLDFLSNVETHGMLNGKLIPITISAVAGIKVIEEPVTNCGTLIEDCNMALNIAKHVIKKPYAFATEEMKQRQYMEKKYITQFSDAIQKKEFKAYYQPKVNSDDYSIVGSEALARWEQNGTLIPPGSFIPVFERNGMVCELDFYILEQVCSDIRHWLNVGINPGRISVNFSRRHLSNPDLAEDIMKILNRYDTESKYVEIELTETVSGDETELLIRFMNKMKAYHVSISIDDFGTGYSSLNLLRSFPVDVLKIDKSFIETLGHHDRIILSNIIQMATQLNMEVIAEGVETRQQLECLREMNCKIIQGFLFDKPMPKEAFEQKMRIGKYSDCAIAPDVSQQ